MLSYLAILEGKDPGVVEFDAENDEQAILIARDKFDSNGFGRLKVFWVEKIHDDWTNE